MVYQQSIKELRRSFKWTTYGKYGTSRPYKILLCNMKEKHIKNCLKNPNISSTTKDIFQQELGYRKYNNITDATLYVQRAFTSTNEIPF